jgi:sugar phosphate isomerase/epimerase
MRAIGVSTSSFFPLGLEDAFRLASESGADGVEVMITNDPATYDPRVLSFLSRRFNMPILSFHAPVLLLTQGVFGHDPAGKVEATAELAVQLGADTIVVHPPFFWQVAYSRIFERHCGEVASRYGVTVAVENMFSLPVSQMTFDVYGKGWNPGALDVSTLTLDFSHAAMQSVSARDLARDWGSRLSHIHLCDGTSPHDDFYRFDAHLPPGHGSQPVGETLEDLGAVGFTGHVIAEVSTRSAKTESARIERIGTSLEFSRTALDRGRVQQLAVAAL